MLYLILNDISFLHCFDNYSKNEIYLRNSPLTSSRTSSFIWEGKFSINVSLFYLSSFY